MEIQAFVDVNRPCVDRRFRDGNVRVPVIPGFHKDSMELGIGSDASSSTFDHEMTDGEEEMCPLHTNRDGCLISLCEEMKLLSVTSKHKRSAQQLKSQSSYGVGKYLSVHSRKRPRSDLPSFPSGSHHCSPSSSSSTTNFDDLCEGVKRYILCRLPAVSVVANRLVNTEWSRILSSENFLRNEWSKRRPDEKWIFLHNPNRPEIFLFYDSTFHQWRFKKFAVSFLTNMILKGLISAGGLLYAMGQGAGGGHILKVCNPLTGTVSTFPLPVWPQGTSSPSIHITEDKKTGSYGILLQGYNLNIEHPILLGDNLHENAQVIVYPSTRTSLYYSEFGFWMELPDFGHQRVFEQVGFGHLHHLKRFRYEDGGLYFYPDHLFELLDKGTLVWFDIQKQEWKTCPPKKWSPDESCRTFRMVQRKCYLKLFERDGELILVTIGRLSYGMGLEIWTSRITSKENDEPFRWRRLDSMPRILALMFLNLDSEYNVSRRFRRKLSSNVMQRLCSLLFFPLGDKQHGDKLLIMNTHTFDMITFNFTKKSREEQWKLLGSPVMANSSDAYLCRRYLKELSDLWEKGVCRACIFEPRLDVHPNI